MKLKFLIYLFIAIGTQTVAQTSQDSVTVRGHVTDYNNNPLDSVTVLFQHPNFSIVCQTDTGSDGYYSLRVPKGKYQSVAAVNFKRYPHMAPPDLPDAEKRLEFWAFNYIADRDTTLNIQYDRMEAYALHAWRIPGATPSYVIYVRPMSLTRALANSVSKAQPNILWAPPVDKLDVKVTIDSEEVEVLMKHRIKEYLTEGYADAYLITVALPKGKTELPYSIFKVVLQDMENGDKGEGIYFMEKPNYL